MSDNPLEKMSTEELMSLWWKDGEQHYTAIAAEIRRRLERLAKLEALIEKAPHAKYCHAMREYHLPGFTHYETDSDEACPAYHFRKGKCDCYRAALEGK